MRIKQHDRSHIVEFADGSAWRIWPADVSETLQWLPTTELDITSVDHEVCSHALVTRSDGSRVRVIPANESWPAEAVRRVLRGG
jgi:hypothetical protein